MNWQDGDIHDCVVRPLKKFKDDRGWLAEVFRNDELPPELHPPMAYLSMTKPGVGRGPHEHVDQADYFLFFDGRYRVYMWDPREDSPTRGRRTVVEAGADEPRIVIVPPGVVHGYRNVGDRDAVIFNCPNRLYAGAGKKEKVDEIRHEEEGNSPYSMD